MSPETLYARLSLKEIFSLLGYFPRLAPLLSYGPASHRCTQYMYIKFALYLCALFSVFLCKCPGTNNGGLIDSKGKKIIYFICCFTPSILVIAHTYPCDSSPYKREPLTI